MTTEDTRVSDVRIFVQRRNETHRKAKRPSGNETVEQRNRNVSYQVDKRCGGEEYFI